MPKKAKTQDGAGPLSGILSMFGLGSPKELGLTQAQYNAAIKHYQQHGGDFMSIVNKIKGAVATARSIAKKAHPIARTINNAVNHKHQGKINKGLDWVQKLAGSGVEGDHKFYGVTKAHYNRALKKHLMHGGSFWDTLKSVASTAKDIAKVALPIAKMGTQFIPEKYRGAVNTGLDVATNLAGSGQEGGFVGPLLGAVAAPLLGKLFGFGAAPKGSPEAKARMAHLRSMRKKKAASS